MNNPVLGADDCQGSLATSPGGDGEGLPIQRLVENTGVDVDCHCRFGGLDLLLRWRQEDQHVREYGRPRGAFVGAGL